MERHNSRSVGLHHRCFPDFADFDQISAFTAFYEKRQKMAVDNTENQIEVTVNERKIHVPQGLTIHQALMQADIQVPNLCYDMRVERSNGNCGLCVVEVGEDSKRVVKACQTPILPGMNITTNSRQLESFRKIRLDQLLSDHNADCEAPCVAACPANIDIQGYLNHVSTGNYESAIKVIKDHNPLPVVCGRVCPHPCEIICRRVLVDTPVAINYVKRFVADLDLARDIPWTPEKAAPSGKRIAVVGSGPAGLSAAYYSALNGHEVTVFESQPEAGGMLRYGIPEYRLPKKTLDREIDTIRNLGVRIVTDKALGKHFRLEELQKDFDATFVAVGSWNATPLNIEGENLDGVLLGIQYLEQVVKGTDADPGEVVVVLGGGNTAIDCVRSAVRRGARKVQLVYRRTREEMPAVDFEIEEAIHEGVEMVFLAAPLRITLNAAGRKEVQFIRMELGEKDRSGRRRPVPVEGSEFIIEADTVIGAIGQSTNTDFLASDLAVRLNQWGDFDVNPKTLECSAEGIFAGGDCVTGPATVIEAIAAGRVAARSMHSYMTKGYISEVSKEYNCSRGSLEDLPQSEFDAFPKIARMKMNAIPDAERIGSFREVELGLTAEQARMEALRCLQCGCDSRYDCALRDEATALDIQYVKPVHERPYLQLANDHPFIRRDNNKCISCARCVVACAEIAGPDVLAMYYEEGREVVGTRCGSPLWETDCTTCGQCVITCPCGALEFQNEGGLVLSAINNPDLTVIGFAAPAVRSVISEVFDVRPEEATAYMAGLMRAMGFDRIFDLSFAADLTVMEETAEFIDRMQGGEAVLPLFTSCCPAWVSLVERRYPELIPHLSSCKSPQQMMGATIKSHFAEFAGIPPEKLYVVSIVPCVAKKAEAARPEFAPGGIRDVDAVLTTSEMLDLIMMLRIETGKVAPAEFDAPYKQASSAGVIFGASGGVAEAALRNAVEQLTGPAGPEGLVFQQTRGSASVKESVYDLGDAKVRLAVISGLNHVEPVIQRILSGEESGFDLIEVMTCPGGCVNGAGNPLPVKVSAKGEREKVLISIDDTSPLRRSQENPDVLGLYKDYFGEPNSELAHKLLHRYYAPFERASKPGSCCSACSASDMSCSKS